MLTRSTTETWAPSTEMGSVKALSTSCTRLLGPTISASVGSLATSATSKPGTGRPIRRGRIGTDFLKVFSRFKVRIAGVILTTRTP